jgi:hypothetical protein
MSKKINFPDIKDYQRKQSQKNHVKEVFKLLEEKL